MYNAGIFTLNIRCIVSIYICNYAYVFLYPLHVYTYLLSIYIYIYRSIYIIPMYTYTYIHIGMCTYICMYTHIQDIPELGSLKPPLKPGLAERLPKLV